MSVNPDIRSVPEVPDEFVRLPSTVGGEWSGLIARGQELDYKECLVVSTPAQMDQALAVLQSEVLGCSLVVVDAKRDYADTQFGVVTVGLLGGSTVIIPLHVLAANASVPVNRLGRTVLAPLVSWTANKSAYVVAHNEGRWREFLGAIGAPQTPIRGLIDVARLVRLAIAEGRLPSTTGPITTELEAKALLEFAYLGAYEGPVPVEDYAEAFPGLSRHPLRRGRSLYQWPLGPNNAATSLELAQVQHLVRDTQCVVRLVNDTIRTHHRRGELREPSRQLGATNKKVLMRALRVTPSEPREVDVLDGPMRDELSLGVSQWSHRLHDEKRARNLAHYGDQQRDDFLAAPGAAFRRQMFDGLCLTCAATHEGPGAMCELGRRLALGQVSNAERHCDHCLSHEHYLAACPVYHTRCTTCRLLGHLPINCQLDTAEYHWLKYLKGCGVAVFASLEVEGPFAGPFGFGVYLTIEITEEMTTIACEVRELARSRYQNAAEPVLRARDRAVHLVAADVPTHALYYANEKSADQTWAAYWQEARRGFHPTQGLGPYRGFDAPLVSELRREEVVDGMYAPLIDDQPGDDIEVYDVILASRLLELRRSEALAVRAIGEEWTSSPDSSPWRTTRSRVEGGQLFSATVISEYPEEPTDLAGGEENDEPASEGGSADRDPEGPNDGGVSDASTVTESLATHGAGETESSAPDWSREDSLAPSELDQPLSGAVGGRRYPAMIRLLRQRQGRMRGSVETCTITEETATGDGASERLEESTGGSDEGSGRSDLGRLRALSRHSMTLRRRM